MISMSRRIDSLVSAGEAEDVAGQREDAALVPLLEHVAIFGDLVLALVGGEQIVRVDVLEPDEGAHHPGALRLVDEIGDAVAERVDLDGEVGLEPLLLAAA